ncbi:MAG TPA: DUF3105 domain-containing protein [Micromonosporaceae bacterium]
MSISTPGGEQRRPAVVITGKNSGKGGKPAGAAGAKGRGPKKPVKPIKVSQERSWGPIALFVAVGLIAAGIIGYGGWAVYHGAKPWQERAAAIDGILDFRESDPKLVEQRNHKKGSIEYAMRPPVAGDHNDYWQNCMGDVYDAPIANEHALHSLEHGAVWVTYRQGLPADQVEALAERVRGNEYMMMSPVENLDAPISLQAWGYQLKVDDVGDKRIDEFIKALRSNASVEPGASCAGGVTATGTTPRDLAGGMQQGG